MFISKLFWGLWQKTAFFWGSFNKGGGGWGGGGMLNNMALRIKNCRPSPRWNIPAHRAPVYGFVKSFPSRNNPMKSEKRQAFKNWTPSALAGSNSLCASLNEVGKNAFNNGSGSTSWPRSLSQLTEQLVVPRQRPAESRQDFVSFPHTRDIVIIPSFTFIYWT